MSNSHQPISLRSDSPTIIDRIRHVLNSSGNQPKSLTQLAGNLSLKVQAVRTAIAYHQSEFYVERVGTMKVRLLDENDASCYNEFVDRFERPIKF